MQVILLERVEKLGQMGDVVKVKEGFARNFLLPRKKALRATKDNVARFETQRAQLVATNLEQRKEAEGVSKKLEGNKYVVLRQAGESGQLYGSVSTRDIADAITTGGVTVLRTQVLLDRPIKTIGLYPLKVQLHPEVRVEVTINVARSADEAERQARGEVIVGKGEDEIVQVESLFDTEEGARAARGEDGAAAEGDDKAAKEKPAKAKAAKADGEEKAEKPAKGKKAAAAEDDDEDAEKPAKGKKK